MKLVLIGATGYVGKALLNEALLRGHHVTAIARTTNKIPPAPHLTVVQGDIYNTSRLTELLLGADAVLSAFNPGWTQPDLRAQFIKGSRSIIEAAKSAEVRLLVVGGAGSLFVAPGVQVIDTEQFPAEWKEGAEGARQMLIDLQHEDVLDWTFLSPAAVLEPGKRTGKYRLGRDDYMSEGDGKPGRISVEDVAHAMLNEVEQPMHTRQRFTLSY